MADKLSRKQRAYLNKVRKGLGMAKLGRKRKAKAGRKTGYKTKFKKAAKMCKGRTHKQYLACMKKKLKGKGSKAKHRRGRRTYRKVHRARRGIRRGLRLICRPA